MKTPLRSSLVLAGLCFSLTVAQAAVDARFAEDVASAITAFKRADSAMADLFTKSAGYAVFPNVGKGGFVLGGAHGNGLVYERGRLIGQASMTQVTLGAQIGGQEFSEVIFFQDAASLKRFTESQFTMNAQAGAVAAAEGVSKNAKFVDGVLVFTLVKQGLMAEASVGGQKFTFRPASQ